jgi:hypothetical protein
MHAWVEPPEFTKPSSLDHSAMSIYFILDSRSSEIKIGRSADIPLRVRALQTGNPGALKLMGWIVATDDVRTERDLHSRYNDRRGIGEWFSIGPREVLIELKRATGFVPAQGDSFEIVGRDRDGVSEYLGVCEWADFELEECCPFCGCFCGMHFQDASWMYHCTNCDMLTNFDSPCSTSNDDVA